MRVDTETAREVPVRWALNAGVLGDPAYDNGSIREAVGRPIDLDSLRDVPDGPVEGAGRHVRSLVVAGDATVVEGVGDLVLVALEGRLEVVTFPPDGEPVARLVGEGQSLAFPPGATVGMRAAASGRQARVLEIHFADVPTVARPELAAATNAVPRVPDYYYGYAERYAAVYAAGGETWETPEPNDALLHALDTLALAPCRVIDLGCGEGRDSVFLATQGFTVTGIDVSRAALTKARERAGDCGVDVEFLERDVVYLNDLPRGGFDLALNMGCLHMIPDADLRAAHLRGVYELLRPGGRFILAHCREKWLQGFYSVPDYDSVGPVVPGRVVERRIRMRDGGTAMLPLPLVPYKESSPEELRAELAAAGLTTDMDLSANTEAFGNTVVLVARRPE